MNDKVLTSFSRYLVESGYFIQNEEPNEKFPFERIIVHLKNDEKNRVRRLLIMPIDYPITKNKDDAEHAIQFFYIFPFSYSPAAIGELSRLLLFYNNSLDLPGLGLEEFDHHLYYRYTFLRPNGFMAKNHFLAFVGSIELIIETFSKSIELVAQGNPMKEVLLEDIKRIVV